MRPLTSLPIAAACLIPGFLAAAPAGLVHHWNFDEGPDWHDSPFQSVYNGTQAYDSEGTSHATLQNMAASSWVSGRQFTGLEFNGSNQYLSVPGNLATDLGGSASLSFWLRTSQTGTASPATAPGVTGSGGIQWGWLDAGGKIGLGLDGASLVQSAAAIHDGRWHHIVLTRDAATGVAQVFVDGSVSASATGPSGIRSTSFASLGRIEGAGNFQGRLDQITIFNRVITPVEVSTQRINHAPKIWNLSSDGVNDRPFSTPSVFSRAYDAERHTLTVKSWTTPAHGSVTHNGDGSFTFTPVADYVGNDSFHVTIEDGMGGYHRATMILKIITEPVGGTHLPVTQFTNFAALQAGGLDISHSGMRVPRAVDWDVDGKKDILIGAGGYVWRYLNTGTAAAPAFAAAVKVQAAGVDIYANTTSNNPITLADMTGDGVPDLVMADSASKLRVYRNTAAAGATPVYAASVFVKKANGTTDFVLPDKRFDIGDYNADGKPDLITGTYSSSVQLYLNANTAASPRFETSSVLFSDAYNIYPRFCDLGLNGQTDLVTAINWGDVKFWLNVPTNGLATSQNFTITDSTGVTPAFQSLTDGVIADFADFNGDGKTDMLVGGHAATKVFIAYGVSKTYAESIAEIEAIYDTNLVGLTAPGTTNAVLSQLNAANANIITHLKNGSLGTRQAVFTALAAHINKYPFLKYQQLDTAVYHHVPSIVLQNWVILQYLLPDNSAHRTSVADIMGLTGTARVIFLENGLALGDNGKSLSATYNTIRDFQRRHPREAFPDAIITFDQLYGDARGGFVWTPNSTKNTFGQDSLGNANEWAGDLTTAIQSTLGAGSAIGDYFTFVMGHEVTHSLDNYLRTRANTDLVRRWYQRIVYGAGPDVIAGPDAWYDQSATQANFQAKGYYTPATQTWTQAWDAYWATGPGAAFNSLASMRIDIKFFLGARQESLATQANHHWANGPGRLIGALDRFRRAESQGIEPMKANMTEAVDFIDFISSGMNRVNLVETKNPTGSNVVWTDHFADLERDDKGRITRITVDGRFYQLTLAENGLVTQVLTEADSAPRNVNFALPATSRNEADGSATITVTLDRPARYTPVTVDFADVGTGTATPGSDYTLTPGTLTFADGEQVKTITVNLLNDAPAEAPEAVILALASPVGASLGGPATHTLLIADATAPVVATQQFTAASNMAANTVIGTVAATPAPGRTVTGWSIVAGNVGGTFSINSSGQVRLVLPASLPAMPSTRQIVVRTVDSSGAAADGTVNIVCNPPSVTGVWERRWSGATPYTSQNWSGATSYSGSLATFTTAQNVGDTYSRRLVGYLQPQVSGNYTFWLAADDAARLFISTNATEGSKSQIASVSSWTNFQSWDSNASQQSAVIPLVAGQIYWLEVQQQEGGGGDHASVAWSGPGISRQAIPASALFPNFSTAAPVPASVILTNPAGGSSYETDSTISVSANVVAGSLAVSSVEFYQGSTLIATDTTAPYTANWINVPVGTHLLTARVIDAGGSVTSGSSSITVTNASTPLQNWQTSNFGADAGNPSIAGDLADPDFDGLKNLIEYALGTDPKTPGSTTITHDLVEIGGTDHLRLTIHRNSAATDVNLIVETCSGLTDWNDADTFIETDTEDLLIVRDTGSGPSRFIRLKVSR
ncbi:MAG: LamG-like jellyroll fold domain-containing protein [Verrucomicrobiota bacterium]